MMTIHPHVLAGLLFFFFFCRYLIRKIVFILAVFLEEYYRRLVSLYLTEIRGCCLQSKTMLKCRRTRGFNFSEFVCKSCSYGYRYNLFLYFYRKLSDLEFSFYSMNIVVLNEYIEYILSFVFVKDLEHIQNGRI